MDMFLSTKKHNLCLLFSVFLMIGALWWSFYHWKSQRMGTNWVGPCLSAAQALNPIKGELLVDLDDLQKFKFLDDSSLEDSYQFSNKGNHKPYIYGSRGYSYLIKFSTLLFPDVGHQLAVIYLQCLLHLLLCFGILSTSSLPFSVRLMFLIFYALNPLILRFVTFNFYYFWQGIPSFGILYIYWKVKNKFCWLLILCTLPLVILVRPTTIFISTAFLLLLFLRHSEVLSIGYAILTLVVVGWLNVPDAKSPWHTFYAGVGGYANPYGISLSDESSYALYCENTGIKLNASSGGNFYDYSVKKKYTAITRQEYLAVLEKSLVLLVKNAIVNFFTSFSLGYVNKAPDWVNYLIALSGLVFAAWLAFCRKFHTLIFLTLGVIGFVFYYPPIGAYMYGNYFITGLGSD
jgi:hypothetical protein